MLLYIGQEIKNKYFFFLYKPIETYNFYPNTAEIVNTFYYRISDEIKALRDQMETFCGKNNNSEEKIFNLQRCVSKMDKLFHKSEKEYLKQIEKLKQDLAKQEKVAQVKFGGKVRCIILLKLIK